MSADVHQRSKVTDSAIFSVSAADGVFAVVRLGLLTTTSEVGTKVGIDGDTVHRQQWRSTLRDHAASIRDTPIDAIDTDAILAVLQPIWLTKSETAKRLRGRIEKILDAAKVQNLRARLD